MPAEPSPSTPPPSLPSSPPTTPIKEKPEIKGAASVNSVDSYLIEDNRDIGLPIEGFSTVKETFNYVDRLVPKSDIAFNVLHQIATSDYEQVFDPFSLTGQIK